MTRTWATRLGMSLMIVVGMWTTRAPAQQPKNYLDPSPPIMIMPAVPYEPGHQPYMGMPFVPKSYPPPADHALRRVLNSHGMGCDYDPYYAGCVNWRYEFRFMFGSCRSFFNESCPPGSLCGPRVTPRP